MKIRFYEKVKVISSQRFPEYIGNTGVVLGISEDETRVYSYSVFFPNEPEGISFLPAELEGTGEIVDRSEFYDESDRLRVRVDDGEGSVADS
jgi:hypothetical protein